MKPKDVDKVVNNLFSKEGVKREYNRIAPFYRLADQLILLRNKRGITQKQLAEKANTTQAVVSRLENAAVHCSMETVIRLAEALDAVVEVNLIEKEDHTETPAQEQTDEHCEDQKVLVESGAFTFGETFNLKCVDIFTFTSPTISLNKIPDPSNPRSLKKKQLEYA